MEGIYVFLLRWDIPILFIATISLIVGLVKLIQARSILRRAVFSLERDYGRETRQNGSALFISSIVIISMLWYVNQFIAPTLPQELLFVPTPTLDPLITPFASPSPENLPTEVITRINREAQLAELVATATLDPGILGIPTEEPLLQEELDAITPTPPPADIFIPDGGGCNPAVNISNPRPESTLNGQIEFIGTATDPEFAYFNLELNGPATGNNWTNLLGSEQFDTIENGSLGVTDFSQLEVGPYRLRLSVYGVGIEPLGQCQISIFIGRESNQQSEDS